MRFRVLDCLNVKHLFSEERRAKIETDYLAKKLRITKGSFYAQFSDRRGFVASIAFYWADSLTSTVLDKFSIADKKGEEKLLLVLQAIKAHKLEKYDIEMRAWTLDEPLVAVQV